MRWHLFQWGLKRGALVAIVVTIARILGLFEFWELKAYDHILTARMHEHERASDRIIVVEATRPDVEAQPADAPKTLAADVSDVVLTNAINQLRDYGARVIGVDWYLPPALKTWTDQNLEAFQGSTAGLSGVNSPTTPNPDSPSTAIYGLCMQPYLSNGELQAPIPPPPAEVIPSERVGFSNFAVDADGVMRRHLVGNALLEEIRLTSSCQAEVAFSTLIALQYLNLTAPTAKSGPQGNGASELTSSSDRSSTIALTDLPTIFAQTPIKLIDAYKYGGYSDLYPLGSELMLNYREPVGNDLRTAFTHVSIMDLQPGVAQPISFAEQFKDKIVLIGLTAGTYVGDEFTTPYGDVVGVTLQAHMVDHLISLALGERQQIWVWPYWVEWLWIMAWAIAGALLGTVGRDRPQWLAISLFGGLLFLYLICRLTMGRAAGWIPMLPPMAAFILSHGIVVYTDHRFRTLDSKRTVSNPWGTEL